MNHSKFRVMNAILSSELADSTKKVQHIEPLGKVTYSVVGFSIINASDPFLLLIELRGMASRMISMICDLCTFLRHPHQRKCFNGW